MTTNERISMLDLAQQKLDEAHDLVQTATSGTDVGGEIYHDLRASMTIRTADGRMAKRDIAYLQQRLRDAEPTAEATTIRVTGLTLMLPRAEHLFAATELVADPTFDADESAERLVPVVERALREAFGTDQVEVAIGRKESSRLHVGTAPKSIADALTELELRAVLDAWNQADEKVDAVLNQILGHPIEGDQPDAWVTRRPARW